MRRLLSLFASTQLFVLVSCDSSSQINCNCNPYVPLKGTWSRTDSTRMMMVDSDGSPADSGLYIEHTLATFTTDGKITASRNQKFLDTEKKVTVIDTTLLYSGIWQTPWYDTVVFHWSKDPLFPSDTLNFTRNGSTLRLIATLAENQDTLLYIRQ